MSNPALPLTGRCYCGAVTFTATAAPQTVTYCHCDDCKRATGGPVAAFAAFGEDDVAFTPDEGRTVSIVAGATRSFCPDCGSALTGRYDYLPNQVYVPLGIIDQADALPPEIHAHAASHLSWLHIEDDLPRPDGSAREKLRDPGSSLG